MTPLFSALISSSELKARKTVRISVFADGPKFYGVLVGRQKGVILYQEYIIEREGEYRTRVYYCGTTLRKVAHPLNDIHACKYKVLNRRQPRGYDLTFAIVYRTYTRVCCCTSSWRHRPSRSVGLSPVRRSPQLLHRQVAGSKRQSSDAGRLVDRQAPPKA